MYYSCFDPSDGLYDYYESNANVPLNADLPVPNLPAEINDIGVPAIVAGRALPFGARHIGRGWHARGMLVNCGRSPMGDSSDGTVPLLLPLLTGIMLFAAGYYARKWRWM